MKINLIPRQVCIIFTDGQANDAKQIPAATKQWEKIGAKVYAVGIGEGIDRKGREYLNTWGYLQSEELKQNCNSNAARYCFDLCANCSIITFS